MRNILVTTNKVLIYLTMSDVFSWGPYLIISALSSLYLANKLGENAAEFVGIGIAIYYITRGFLQIPLGALTDKLQRDRDEIILLFIGVLLTGLPFIFYPLINDQYQYYLLQFVFGFGTSLNVTNWRKLFALNIREGREGISYAKYETVMSFATALLSILVGIVANLGGAYFDLVMPVSGVVMMSASVWVSFIFRTKQRKSNTI